MRLPPQNAHYIHRVRYGRYVARRLRKARLTVLAASVEKVSQAVLTYGRAVEDAEGPIQDALADRDAADTDLDRAAQDARARLAGRSADAIKNVPYTVIFPDGISYYTAAPLDEEQQRYTELKKRLVEHLPQTDEVRCATVPLIDTGLAEFIKGAAQLEAVRTDAALASTRLTSSTEAWDKQIEKTYGALVAEVGRAAAEGFFPRVSARKTAPASDGDPA